MSEAIETVHIFTHGRQADGSDALQIFKRVDLHQIQWVATVYLAKGIDPTTLGGLVCESFNSELRTRGAAQKESNG